MLNHVVLMGRLTADPELHMIDAETQKCVCNVVIACERKKKEQVGVIPACSHLQIYRIHHADVINMLLHPLCSGFQTENIIIYHRSVMI